MNNDRTSCVGGLSHSWIILCCCSSGWIMGINILKIRDNQYRFITFAMRAAKRQIYLCIVEVWSRTSCPQRISHVTFTGRLALSLKTKINKYVPQSRSTAFPRTKSRRDNQQILTKQTISYDTTDARIKKNRGIALNALNGLSICSVNSLNLQ